METDVIRWAREAGIDAESDTLCRYEGWVKPLERFAALVIANNPPQTFMSYQEGYAAGVAAEREACAKAARTAMLGAERALTERVLRAIRARGQG